MTLTKGDHLVVTRPIINGRGKLYTHHGIYVGDNRVIHYSGLANGLFSKGSSKVERVTVGYFGGGSAVRVQNYPSCPFTQDEIVRRAESRMGEDRYNLFRNNCEHFAHYCCVGEHYSSQVRWHSRKAAIVVCGVMLGIVARAAL